ncbi:hypothetical protein MNB_SM-7-842 [hydrothermal vent metagenome]|uniref:Uncharacterized protein n=1 Tax=hydrothermal vent metagenome TaxID=652676 RepID=A0A1W1BQJ3_9ZZZZ
MKKLSTYKTPLLQNSHFRQLASKSILMIVSLQSLPLKIENRWINKRENSDSRR